MVLVLARQLQFSYRLTQTEILPTSDITFNIGKLSLPDHIRRAGTKTYFLLHGSTKCPQASGLNSAQYYSDVDRVQGMLWEYGSEAAQVLSPLRAAFMSWSNFVSACLLDDPWGHTATENICMYSTENICRYRSLKWIGAEMAKMFLPLPVSGQKKGSQLWQHSVFSGLHVLAARALRLQSMSCMSCYSSGSALSASLPSSYVC